ncbi:DoxX family protein [Kitasatospora terrestris]|uniref:DoxX family protein n=1 Tax=Kitasatospora terrestris TaxID=258051 RepID=UPI0031E51197
MKVPSDPAKLSSTQASFRVRLAAPVAPLIDTPAGAAFGDPYGMQSLGGRPLVTPQVVVPASSVALAGVGAAGAVIAGSSAAPRRKARVVTTWSGQAAAGDLAATGLLDAVRLNTVPAPAQAPPGVEDTQPLHAVPRQASPPPGAEAPVVGVPEVLDEAVRVGANRAWAPDGELPEVPSMAGDSSKHAWYPGRRVDLGLVLLPLRIVLGGLSVYAGFSKLCDPVYFDGGERGSMMRWLSSLHPWKVAQPLLDFAMAHPVGSGLAVAFIEIVVGVLSILGLWQRAAAGIAMALSAALLFTVSWKAVPVYDTPDLIFLAAWSPLLIAGAPFGSLDGRIALEAWRRCGPGNPGGVRRRMVRRRSVVTAVVIGLTLLTGSMLGAAVRTGNTRTPVRPPTDFGSPMWPGNGPASPSPKPTPTPTPSKAPASPTPSPGASKSGGASTKPKPGTSPSSTGRQPTGGTTGGTTSTGHTGTGGGSSTPRSTPTGGGGGLIGGVLGSRPPLLGLSQSEGA